MFYKGTLLIGQKGQSAKLFAYMNFFALFLALIITQQVFANTQAAPQQLADRYQLFLEDYYRSKYVINNKALVLNDLASVHRHATLAQNKSHAVPAIAYILANKKLIKENIDSEYAMLMLTMLLEHGLLISAMEIVDYALANSSFETVSKVHYSLGVYYFNLGKLTQSLQHLSAIDDRDALSERQKDYATVIFGVILQRNRSHREAIKIYDRVGKTSYYYSYAQLNKAVANIRQGWWTDAQIAIELALGSNIPPELSDMANRLILVMAYSQLKNEFYRDARKTLGKISLDSGHINKALLGLGLSALHQKDYPGAINAFSRLQQRSGDDLEIMEANLLVPYSYDQMGDKDKAAEGYANAMSLFESKLFLIDAQLLSLKQTGQVSLNAQLKSVLPTELLTMTENLSMLDSDESNMAKKIEQMRSLVNDELVKHVERATNDKKASIKSYISQSQYGLAKLYDNP